MEPFRKVRLIRHKQRCEEKQSSCYRKGTDEVYPCGYFCFFYLTGSTLSAKFLLQMLKIIFVFAFKFYFVFPNCYGKSFHKKFPYTRANLTRLISSELFLKKSKSHGTFQFTVIRKQVKPFSIIYLKPQISSKHNFVNLYLTQDSIIMLLFIFFQTNSTIRAFLILNDELW